MDGLKINPNLRRYKHRCKKCGLYDILTTIPQYGEDSRPCKCGGEMHYVEIVPQIEREVFDHPLVNFNNWKPDYRQMDGEKEAIAGGMYE